MKKTIATFALLFVVFTNLNATEAPNTKNDANCTVEKCKTKKASDANCTLEKCKTMSKKDCATQMKKKCSRDAKQTSNDKTPTWSATQNGDSNMKKSACCANKKAKESKEESTEKPMKCAAGKCGGGKCGGK